MRRLLPISIAVLLLALLWEQRGLVHGQTNVGKSKPRIPVHATLSTLTVQPNDQEKITIKTLANATIQMHVIYPQSGEFKTHGLSGKSGKWQHIWAVHAQSAGLGSVVLYFTHGKDHRYYTLHFTVTVPSPTSTITSAPTSTSTATPSQGPPPPPGPLSTNVPTASPIATTTSTVTATATGTQTVTATATGTQTVTTTVTPMTTGTITAENYG